MTRTNPKAATVAIGVALFFSLAVNLVLLFRDENPSARPNTDAGGGLPAKDDLPEGNSRRPDEFRRAPSASGSTVGDEVRLLQARLAELQAEMGALKEENERLASIVDDASRARERTELETRYVAETMTELANTTELENFAGAKGQRRMFDRLAEILPAKKAADLTKLYFMLCMYEGRNALPTKTAGQWKPSPDTPPEIDAMLLNWRNEIDRAGSLGRFAEEKIKEIAGGDALSTLRSASIPPFPAESTPNYAEARSQWDQSHPLYSWRRFLVNQ